MESTALSKTNADYLNALNDIFEISAKHSVKSYVWGGLAVDILHGALTREHGDLDCFTDSLMDHLPELTDEYIARGYEVNYLEDFWMLQVKKDGIHAAFNNLRIVDGIAHWHHIGAHGTVFFPSKWLDRAPRSFYGAQAYTAGARFLYALKTKVKLVNPEWQPREKDRSDIDVLRNMLQTEKITDEEIYGRIWSHNPFWYARGYEEYFKPVIVG